MLGIHDFWLFALSGLMLNLTPGPDTLYVVGRSVAQGRRVGLLSVFGISSGVLVHTCAAGAGLSALLAGSATAFTVVRYAGAAYLAYLGLRLILAPGRGAAVDGGAAAPGGPSWAAYRQGVVTNVLNPKVALFFLAFLPQFVDPTSPHRIAAFFVLGLVFVASGTLWCVILVCFAAAVSRRARERPAAGRWLNRVSGGVFIGLGVMGARG
jgi:threonine/homoserine/homoserine lactone efflux protein